MASYVETEFTKRTVLKSGSNQSGIVENNVATKTSTAASLRSSNEHSPKRPTKGKYLTQPKFSPLL